MTDSQPSTQRPGSLFAVFLAVFIDLLGFGMVIPLIAIYAKELTDDANIITALAVSFSLMQFLCSPVWGKISDRIGRRPVLLIGLAGSVVFYAIYGVASMKSSLTWMFVSRIGAGIAGATISTAQAYIADTTTKEDRTKGMALIGAAFGLGFTFGPLLAAAALIPGQDAISPWPGFVAAGLSLSAFIYAFFKLPESLTRDSENAETKMLDVGALRASLSMPTVGGLLATSFLVVLSFANFEAILAFLLKTEPAEGGFGYDLQKVVLIFALLGFIHALAQGMVRSLSKRMSEANLATGGAMCSLAGFAILAYATAVTSLTLILVGMLVVSIGIAFIPAAISSLISRRSNPAHQGKVLGVSQSLGALARILGHGAAYQLFLKVDATAPFWFGVAIMVLAFGLISIFARRGKDFAEPPQETTESDAT